MAEPLVGADVCCTPARSHRPCSPYNVSMKTLPPNPPAAIDPWRWRVVWLMFLATMINYMDRQALGATSQLVMDEFRLTEKGYGWVEFWFGLAYGLFQVPAGFLADRMHLRWL